ncbi:MULTISPECIES: HAD family hydrolase [unclassified Streptomyces]|uniref:HAD family hydrolase n=1 Tax=unclassified Streptomyces TaxID=2593676 RepID=UPI002DDC457C|nr:MULTISPECIES: HAD family hydrolase [unclassified Streptomyces]WSA94456.1 HAD family hydrolase [Streptomyces sp. NBC_01795]WSB78875.1 HAD family hydrolase [Streptomyces sp. NBC_01775]WSS12923.1 HAD family hydrolase [Streptomyces sp. NBC_01186]WSS41706.1 HAD family hydrolase [Streptomyces sp. NBC_01187]
MRRNGQVLVFDADDTLWENNVLFERVIADFLDWLEHPTLDKLQLRAVLDDIQRANAAAHGYGTQMLLRSLADCVERLRDRPATAEESDAIRELAALLIDHQVELIPGVAETLAALGERHELLMLTKGDPDEQRRKVDASGLASRFRAIGIVREKDEETYRAFLQTHALTPVTCWMIGNSPKSDILPARRAGMNAVFVPHPHTWALEHGELDPDDERVLRLRTFRELLDHF